jgi:flagella basal body P-ring formation protein FlgA
VIRAALTFLCVIFVFFSLMSPGLCQLPDTLVYSARPLSSGHVITAQDIVVRPRTGAHLIRTVCHRASEVIGQRMAQQVPAGETIMPTMLETQTNQPVTLVPSRDLPAGYVIQRSDFNIIPSGLGFAPEVAAEQKLVTNPSQAIGRRTYKAIRSSTPLSEFNLMPANARLILLTKVSMTSGHEIQPRDIKESYVPAWMKVDYPGDFLTDKSQAIGRRIISNIAEGEALKKNCVGP